MQSRIRLVILEGHTLGCLYPDSKYMTVFHASKLRGATGSTPVVGPIYIDESIDNIRLASEKDFDEFRVFFSEEYRDENKYEFQK